MKPLCLKCALIEKVDSQVFTKSKRIHCIRCCLPFHLSSAVFNAVFHFVLLFCVVFEFTVGKSFSYEICLCMNAFVNV